MYFERPDPNDKNHFERIVFDKHEALLLIRGLSDALLSNTTSSHKLCLTTRSPSQDRNVMIFVNTSKEGK